MAAIGSITVSPEVMPGAERVSELREKISDLSATCVFSEPQFEPKLVETLVDGTGARTGVLDPLVQPGQRPRFILSASAKHGIVIEKMPFWRELISTV